MIHSIALVAGCFLLCLTGSLTAEDWQHWRGMKRNDLSTETSQWTGCDWFSRTPLWKKNVGQGGTSPLVNGDQLFVTGWSENHDVVSCLDSKTGSELWSVRYPCPQYGRNATGDEGLYSGPTATPEYDTETKFLYTLSCDGDLNCWDTSSQGKKIWGINLCEKYEVRRRPRIGRSGHRDYGYTTSPLVHEDWLLVEVGAETGTVVAFDKQTGKQVWSSEAKGPAGHTGGLVPIQVEGVPCIAVLTCYGLLVTQIDEKSPGATVAEYEWTTSFINNIATPAVQDNYVLITSAYNKNAICKLEITLQGAKKIWEQKDLASKVCSPVIHDGKIYWAWQQLHCLDFETGKQLWQGGSYSDAGSCLITSDARIIVWGGRGKLALVETAVRSPGKYEELVSIDNLAKNDVWPHVVLSNGLIYCKDRNGTITCLAPGRN